MYSKIFNKAIGAFGMWLYKGGKTEILEEYENYSEKHFIAGFIACLIFIVFLILFLIII